MTAARSLLICSLVVAAVLALVPAASAATNHVFTVAGGGSGGLGDGGPAIDAELVHARGVAVTADGGLLIADTLDSRVRLVSPLGLIATVAGDGSAGFGGDGGPATSAQLNFPQGIAATAGGDILIADTENHRVRRVSPQGVISTVAGDGTVGSGGDGGPATSAQLAFPTGVAATADGGFLIADADNDRVRRVSPQGVITTVAGGGSGGLGDGGPATGAQLDGPTGVAATADGGFMIADSLQHRVRRVSPGGVIATVAGSGTPGFAGDGLPATAARLNGPTGVATAPDGGFVIADSSNHRIRRVSPQGTMTTVAGRGTAGLTGDGGAATSAQLDSPTGVAVTRDGGFLIADVNNERVRFVDADLRAPGVGPSGPPGPQGPAGPAGPQGPAEQAAVVERLRLAVADTRLRARPRNHVTLRYVATMAADVALTVRRGGRTVARRSGQARAGRNRLRVRVPGRPGRYTLALEARAAGQRAMGRVVLSVRRGQ